MTVLEIIQRSTEFLTRKGVDSPRLQAELLLAQVLQLPRLKLYLNFERTLTDPETEKLRDMVKRRGQREPLQHILGTVSFCGVELAVNREVLIPRPETELLAERAWGHLGKLTSAGLATPRVLDFGTGSGCLAVALALKCPQAQVQAIDISEQALEMARQNAARHQVTERIQFAAGNGFAALPAGESPFALIVSNPPYIPSQEIKTLQPEVRDFDPLTALDGGPDGLSVIRNLAAQGLKFLVPGGYLMMEFGDGQAEAIHKVFAESGWTVDEIVKDYTDRARILIAHRPVS